MENFYGAQLPVFHRMIHNSGWYLLMGKIEDVDR